MAETTTAPTRAPTRTVEPFHLPQPDEDPGYQMDPDKLCPAQKTKITRTVSPFLP